MTLSGLSFHHQENNASASEGGLQYGAGEATAGASEITGEPALPAANTTLPEFAVKDGAGQREWFVRSMPWVRRIAAHLRTRLPDCVQMDDLIQAGMLGLVEALRRYDPGQRARFTTFAEQRVRGAMLDELRKGDWVPRSVYRKAREVAAAARAAAAANGGEIRSADIARVMGISVAEYYTLLTELWRQKLLSIDALDHDEESGASWLPGADPGPAEHVQREEMLARLVKAIDRLPERERLVIALYYGEGFNLREIGAVLEVSDSRVSQLCTQALVRLRARVNQ